MIIEGVVTTLKDDLSCHVAPMGPRVQQAPWRSLVLRPFQTSSTFANLQRRPFGVFHVLDDSLLLAQAAVHHWDEAPRASFREHPPGWILQDACRWYAFRVTECDRREERTTMHCEIVDEGVLKEFLGWNRAQHAVVEAAILATRVHLLPREEIEGQLQSLGVVVEKTAGPRERLAFSLLRRFIAEHASSAAS